MATLQQGLSGFSAATVADFSRRETQERLSSSAMQAFFRLVEAWKLRDGDGRQLLGGVSNGVYYQMKRGQKKVLDQDRLTRISLLIGMFRALNVLYGRKFADSWITLPNTNPVFQGGSPLAYMVRGGLPALIRVRQLLDARREGR